MLSKNIVSALTLLTLLGFAFCLAEEKNLVAEQELVSQEEQGKQQEWAVDATLEDKTTLKFPYFDDNYKEINENLRLLHVSQMNDLLNYLTEVVDHELEKPGSTGFLGWLKVGKNLISLGYSQRGERVKLKAPYQKEKEYNTFMSNMFKRLMVESKARATTIKKESKEELRKRLVDYTSNLKKSIELSKVGPYMNLEAGLMNGEKFTDVTTDLMASLRNNGFEKFLGCIDNLMSIIAMFR